MQLIMNNNDTDRQDQTDQGPDDNDADLMDDDKIELIKCPNCGRMISELAQQCPFCKEWIVGTGQAGAFQGRRWWWVVLAIIGIAMFVLFYAM